MSNDKATLINFKARPVSFLWSVRKGVKPAWRVSASPAVLPFPEKGSKPVTAGDADPDLSTLKADQWFQSEAERNRQAAPWETMETVNRELIDEIKAEIDRITDGFDRDFDETVNEVFGYLIEETDDTDLLKAFERNFSAKRHNDLDFLPETYDEMEDGPALLAFLEERGVEKETIAVWIRQLSEAETADYYIQYNEVHSVQLGEYQYEIDVEYHPELRALIDRATETEIKLAKAQREGFAAYGRPGERVIWKVDAKAFVEKVKAETSKGGAA